MSLLESVRGLRVPTPHPPRRGVFISFEGGDGAGKSTQMAMLRDHLVTDRSVAEDLILSTREPGGTPLGTSIRELLLHGEDVDPRAEALLYAADRAHHVATVVKPHLARGGLVLGDRYLDSSVAYQGAGRELEGEEIASLSLWAVHGLLPHRTILLDVPIQTLDERRAEDRDRLERAGDEFHAAVREEFLDLARAEPERFAVIDGTLPREEVHRQVLAAVGEVLSLFDPTFEPAPPRRHRDEQ
ncbi:dTMP kinase [Brachybacterium saurashtrense]|uniref:Thymidylate kinase n=1 Tax=Brachybacterium saurashtrense TaxID=556288 RepID=A0A345YQ39_9MICO|nr:dTMP kinase [Brachybacterium saurashtrense]AXK46041.1 dTMP kinase [Brachybacterium saurashtrense]RRR23780.1 dTMP kinase [Brachybacterium saurashtrense]